ncbi:hypothetical protein BHAOGJBA_5150 [Methylobacterium hispanicum]|uniref:Uncharacterized protein n=1 Tax=Methylobacterium hispanicum TaxID=270350 RepID=A0AAV4ZTS9_9HYPH|nr:hypothetical protein [Methylobacterium hispanicum]GJD91602.1 hypothetical protein BHAOGJBA_5150 [Methylobacterium hispanicum]
MSHGVEEPVAQLLEILVVAGGAVGIGRDDLDLRSDAVSIRPAGIVVELTEPRDGIRRWRTGYFYEVALLGGEATPRRETLRIDSEGDLVVVAKAALVAAVEKMIDRAIDARS